MSTTRRILVVDDEPLIASFIAEWLIEMEYAVAGPVMTAPEALQLSEQTPIDAAFLDVTLGSGDSFALADALLAKGVAVAFITGRDAHTLPEKFRSTPILGKPFDFEAMKTLLDDMLGSAGDKPAPE
jgi:DNA-binding response OmpR family regulator